MGDRQVSISLSSGFSFQGGRLLRRLVSSHVSISLSSGFSFQGCPSASASAACPFPSRYRAAFHFRFNASVETKTVKLVSISLSSGFSFQGTVASCEAGLKRCFNLVIERLFISGCRGERPRKTVDKFPSRYRAAFHFRGKVFTIRGQSRRFNLVIERLFISGLRRCVCVRHTLVRFNLVIERLFISG